MGSMYREQSLVVVLQSYSKSLGVNVLQEDCETSRIFLAENESVFHVCKLDKIAHGPLLLGIRLNNGDDENNGEKKLATKRD